MSSFHAHLLALSHIYYIYIFFFFFTLLVLSIYFFFIRHLRQAEGDSLFLTSFHLDLYIKMIQMTGVYLLWTCLPLSVCLSLSLSHMGLEY